jgi:peptidoglycan/xylan/chitin deacetylase (PgdA/CDA1 family)
MIKNFLFHRVSPIREKLWDPMDVKLFERCIKKIKHDYEVVLLEDLVTNQIDKKTTKNFATILFDDGYKDNIDFAAEILQKQNCKASFYVVTDCIEKNELTWTHQLEYAFQHTQKKEIDLHFDFLPEIFRVKNIQSTEERIQFVSLLKPALKKVSHETRNKVLKHIHTQFNDVELPKMMMNWEDLKELKTAGHIIGSHTKTHCMLGTMSDESEIKFELTESMRMIEKNVGIKPITISYPVGSYNSITKKLSAECGYRIGLAVNQEIYYPEKNDVFEIPRIELYNESWWKTNMRINHSLEKIKQLLRKK